MVRRGVFISRGGVGGVGGVGGEGVIVAFPADLCVALSLLLHFRYGEELKLSSDTIKATCRFAMSSADSSPFVWLRAFHVSSLLELWVIVLHPSSVFVSPRGMFYYDFISYLLFMASYHWASVDLPLDGIHVSEVVILVFVGAHLMEEFSQFIESPLAYIRDGWNQLDTLMYGLLISGLVLKFTDPSVSSFSETSVWANCANATGTDSHPGPFSVCVGSATLAYALASPLVYVRLLSVGRNAASLGPLLVMISEITTQISAFLLLFGIIAFGASQAFQLILGSHLEQYSSRWISFKTVFFASLFGQWDDADIDGVMPHWGK